MTFMGVSLSTLSAHRLSRHVVAQWGWQAPYVTPACPLRPSMPAQGVWQRDVTRASVVSALRSCDTAPWVHTRLHTSTLVLLWWGTPAACQRRDGPCSARLLQSAQHRSQTFDILRPLKEADSPSWPVMSHRERRSVCFSPR